MGMKDWKTIADMRPDQLEEAAADIRVPEGLEDRLAVRPEDEKDLLKNVVLDECQKDVFIFVPGNYEALADFAQTTDFKIVFIGGDLDPWSAVYVDGGGNPNFRSYIFTRKSHRTQIADFDQQTQDEIVNSIKSWLQ